MKIIYPKNTFSYSIIAIKSFTKLRNTRVILKLRYLFYFIIGINSFLIRKVIFSLYHKKNNLNYKNLAVCGRGISANKYFKADFQKHSRVFIVNYSHNDLLLRDYLNFINKELVIVNNVTEAIPNMILLLPLKVCEVIIAQPNEVIKTGFKKSKRVSYRSNLLGVNVRGHEKSKYIDINKRNKDSGGIGTGIYAIYEAAEFAMKNNIREILLYGFDFYIGPRNKLSALRNHYKSEKEYLEHMADNLKLSKSLDFLVSKYPKIKFINHTLNKFKFKSNNIKTYLYQDI